LSLATQNRFAARACSLSCFAVFLTLSLCPSSLSAHLASPQEPQAGQQKPDITHAAPRGKKLMLSDGTFHLVRSYERQGDRVRYYSIERSAWEEIPASLIDWAATQKEEASEAALEAKIEEKKKEFRMQRIAEEVDADASLEVAPRIFLPDGPGLFVLEGKTIRSLELIGADVKTDKRRILAQIFTPIRLPTLQRVEIPGARAAFRITSAQPEFFIRTPDGHEPDMELIQARVKDEVREIGRVNTLASGDKIEDRKVVSVERWKLAKGVFRLTLSLSLEPGEYVLAEIRPEEGMDLGVWDFGVDPPSPKAGAAPASAPKPPTKK
jgi:catechol 2,3-dioxygenase-like lactoylglutathione lyase family enzyme